MCLLLPPLPPLVIPDLSALTDNGGTFWGYGKSVWLLLSLLAERHSGRLFILAMSSFPDIQQTRLLLGACRKTGLLGKEYVEEHVSFSAFIAACLQFAQQPVCSKHPAFRTLPVSLP